MARLFTTGFEWSDAAGEIPGLGSSVAASSSAARSGTYGMRYGGGGTPLSLADTGVLARTYYFRTYIRISGNPSSAFPFFNPTGSAWTIPQMRVTTSGEIEIFQGGSQRLVSSALSANTWYRAEMSWIIQSAGTDTVELLVDGTSLGTAALTISTSAHTSLTIGDAASVGVNIDLDDIGFNDDQGADQNTWPGSGKVVLCIPISDSQDGSWRGGASGTGIDFSTAVNNIPPVGVASGSATDTSQIESADSSGNNTTDEYRANMTTYTTAGIGASDTISLVHPMVNAGEDIATNSKAVSVGCQSNPAGTMAGGTVDAGAIGTWPSNWRTFLGPPVYSPSVTLGNSPVVALRKTDTGTRVLGVAAVGLYVDYIPAEAFVPYDWVVPGVQKDRPIFLQGAVGRAANW